MNVQALLYVVSIVFVAWVMWKAIRGIGRHREQQQGVLSADALARGWRFEAGTDGLFDLLRWSGLSDGVGWSAEYRRSRRRKSSGHSRAQRLRWWSDGVGGPSSPLLLIGVPRGQEAPAVKLAQGEGLLASMAQKAVGMALDQALDVHFGEALGRQVDARDLRMVDDAGMPGFMLMATDVGQARFWLDQPGHRDVLAAQVGDASSALSDDQHRPWVLLMGQRLNLAQSVPVRTTDDLERLVRAGVVLAKALG